MTELGKDGIVRFSFYRPGVSGVSIATDVADWEPQHSMHSNGNGWWSATLALSGGEYRFRYVADGEWYTDFASNGVEHRKGGGWDSVLVVPTSEAHGTVNIAM
jgi:1,4-alpha-glucan branching enzyme